MPSPSDLPARITRSQASDLMRQARRVKYSPISGSPRPRIAAPPYGIGLIPAIVTTDIPAGGGYIPSSSGRAQLYYMDKPDDATATADADNDDVTVLCWYEGINTVVVGKHIFLALWANQYWFITGDC
jgi:hypothetical protein